MGDRALLEVWEGKLWPWPKTLASAESCTEMEKIVNYSLKKIYMTVSCSNQIRLRFGKEKKRGKINK